MSRIDEFIPDINLSDFWESTKESFNYLKDDALPKVVNTVQTKFAEAKEYMEPKIEEGKKSFFETIEKYPNESAAGAAFFGAFHILAGKQDIAEGNKKIGLFNITLGASSLGLAAYIQKDVLQSLGETIKKNAPIWAETIKDYGLECATTLAANASILAEDAKTYGLQAKEWIDLNLDSNPELTTLTGAFSGFTLARGINDCINGNKKSAAVNLLTSVSLAALTGYGLVRDNCASNFCVVVY